MVAIWDRIRRPSVGFSALGSKESERSGEARRRAPCCRTHRRRFSSSPPLSSALPASKTSPSSSAPTPTPTSTVPSPDSPPLSPSSSPSSSSPSTATESGSESERAVAVAPASLGAPELSLVFTALLWGSYSPALRFLFELPQPPSPATLTAARAVLQAGLLLAFAAGSSLVKEVGSSPPSPSSPLPSSLSSPSSSSSQRDQTQQKPPPLPADLSSLARIMRTPTPSLALAGAELGFWNLAASAFHAAGLSRTSATEAAFVVCATGLLTPLYASLAGERQGSRVWGGCGVALLGAMALSLDKAAAVMTAAAAATAASGGGAGAGASSAIPSMSTSLAGDGLVLCAACFYAAATFRLSVLAPVYASSSSSSNSSSSSSGPQALAAAKSVAFAAGAVAWALSSGALLAPASEGGIESLLPGVGSTSSSSSSSAAAGSPSLVLVWTALGPGALAAFLQARGQSSVRASTAQALFATVPLWSAAMAAVALGERIGPVGWFGGLLIVAGGAVAATAPREED